MTRPALGQSLLSASPPLVVALFTARLWLLANGDGPLDAMFFEAGTGGLLVASSTILAGLLASLFLLLSARYVRLPVALNVALAALPTLAGAAWYLYGIPLGLEAVLHVVPDDKPAILAAVWGETQQAPVLGFGAAATLMAATALGLFLASAARKADAPYASDLALSAECTSAAAVFSASVTFLCFAVAAPFQVIPNISPSDVESLRPLFTLTSIATAVRYAAWALAAVAGGVGVVSLKRSKRAAPLAVALLLIFPVVAAEAALSVKQRELDDAFDSYRPAGLMTVTGEVAPSGTLLLHGTTVERKTGELDGPLAAWLCAERDRQRERHARLFPETDDPRDLWIELAPDADAKTFTSVVEQAAQSGFQQVLVIGAPPHDETKLEQVPTVHRPLMAARFDARQGFTFNLTADAQTKLPDTDLAAFVHDAPKAVFMEPQETRCAPPAAEQQLAETQLSREILERMIPDGGLPPISALWSETRRTFVIGRWHGDKDVGLVALGGSSFHAGFTQWDEESPGLSRRAQDWADDEGLSPLSLVPLEDINLGDEQQAGRAGSWDGHKLKVQTLTFNPPKAPKNVASLEPDQLAVSPDGKTVLVRWRPLDKKNKPLKLEAVDELYDLR